jgi:CBS domain-containing protein
MRVGELLRRKSADVIAVPPTTSLGEAARLFLEHRIGGVAVVSEGGELLGFLAEREFVTAVDETNASIRRKTIDKVMKTPAPTCSADDTIHDVMLRMTNTRQRHLVVVDGAQILGVISVGDMVKFRLEELETEAAVLRDYVAGHRAIG